MQSLATKSMSQKSLPSPMPRKFWACRSKTPKAATRTVKVAITDSEWSYHAIEGDKWLYFDVLYAGRKAPPHLTQTMFSMLPADGSKSTPVDGLGGRRVFYTKKTGRP